MSCSAPTPDSSQLTLHPTIPSISGDYGCARLVDDAGTGSSISSDVGTLLRVTLGHRLMTSLGDAFPPASTDDIILSSSRLGLDAPLIRLDGPSTPTPGKTRAPQEPCSDER